MELFKAEAAAITSRVEEWMSHQDFELEATFKGGEVDATTFMAVAQRLRAKGYVALPQEDHLNITTPEHVRITLSSFSTIQEYCRSDVIRGGYTAVIKNRATAESQVDLEDYDVRIKVRRETPMANDDAKLKEILGTWRQQRKAFRMIRRWSFEHDGVRIDMSIVRSTRVDRAGNFKWQRLFRDQDIMMAAPKYEIEAELLRINGDSVDAAKKRLIRAVGEVLRGIQKHTLLLRKSARTKVLTAYKEMTGSELFRGPALRTLRKKNFVKERVPDVGNIRDGYNVTDKADGLRVMGFVDAKGELYLLDMSLNVYRTGLRRPELRLSLVDAEWVTKSNDSPPKPIQQLLIFDVFYMPDKKDVSQFPFQPGAVAPSRVATEAGESTGAAPQPQPPENSRYNQLKTWVTIWNKDAGPESVAPGMSAETKLQVAAKDFQFGRAGDDSIFRMAARVLNVARPYYTDGLIFTPNAAPLPKKSAATFNEQFKWKPSRDNTIDFLVVTEKEEGAGNKVDKISVGVKPGTQETVTYKTLKLFVGSTTENPRDIILNKKELPPTDYTASEKWKANMYRPVVFIPKEFPDPKAAICKLEVKQDPDSGEMYVSTDHTGEPIQSNTIVEMAYDPSRPEEWRWIPLRVRTDKTERFQRREFRRTMNADVVADDVWESIYDPITESMIKTGAEEPLPSEIEALGADAAERFTMARRYYERPVLAKDQKLAGTMKKFHTQWIKEVLLYRVGLSGESKKLLDLACGVAGDLHVWRRVGARFVFGLDNASKNIIGTDDSAYTRYLKIAQEAGGMAAVTPMLFAIADSSKPLITGEAGKTEQEMDILRAVFARQKPAKPDELPPYVKDVGAGWMRDGADCVACMFALHYFFEKPEKLNGLLRNIADTLKVGGYFIGCCFDGEKVFDLLRGQRKGEAKQGMEKGSILWRITRQYEEEDMPTGDSALGLPIDVQFATIGMEHREYLVPFKLLEEKMRLVGCELLTGEELKEFGMVNSSATFDVSWEMAKKARKQYDMSDAAKEFSFLNRWFVFKRKRQESMAEAAAAEAAAVVASQEMNARDATIAAAVGQGNNQGRMAAARAAAALTADAATAIQRESPKPTAREMGEALNNAAAAAAAVGTTEVPGAVAGTGKVYRPEDIFLFYQDAAMKDVLKMKDVGAARWISPGAPFPIEDPDDSSMVYPSIEHFLGGMRVKYASNKTIAGKAIVGPVAASIFGRDGTIHQKFLNDRRVETDGGKKPLAEKRDAELLKAELTAVKDAMKPIALKRHGIVVDEAAWAEKKDAFLEEALKQRWTKDARFRKVLEAARANKKTLLYYTPGSSSSNVGGILRKQDGRIDGENKIGKIMMKLAGYTE